jgi:phosphoribosylanthranilate isomerase
VASVELLMEVKICGLCRPEDAVVAAAAGASYVGVILSPGSRRSQSLASAGEILDAAGMTRRVGVFVDAEAGAMASSAERLGLHALQLHGAEPPVVLEALRAGGWRVWKALRPRDASEFLALLARYASVADGILLDGNSAHAAGGTGTAFPWREVARVRDRFPPQLQLIVAGGLDAANVEEAITLLSPDVVDVSSGVEQALGVKSEDRVRAFIAAAHTVVPNRRIP